MRYDMADATVNDWRFLLTDTAHEWDGGFVPMRLISYTPNASTS